MNISTLFYSDEEPKMTEIWYTPHDENRIEEIFEAMKHCQSLHPDPNGLFIDMVLNFS